MVNYESRNQSSDLPIVTFSSYKEISVLRILPSDGSKVQCFAPFLNEWCFEAKVVDNDRIIAIGNSTSIALYDMRKRAVVARCKIRAKSIHQIDENHIAVVGVGRGLYILELDSLSKLHSAEYVRQRPDGSWEPTEYLAELFDAGVVKKRIRVADCVTTETEIIVTTLAETEGYSEEYDPKVPTLRFSHDLSKVKVEFVSELERELHQKYRGSNPLKWLSPKGKFALRPSWFPVHYSDNQELAEPSSVHPDFQGREGLGLCLEIWSLEQPAQLLRSPVVLIPSDEGDEYWPSYSLKQLNLNCWNNHTNCGSDPVTCHLIDDDSDVVRMKFADFMENISNILWEEDEAGFWVHFQSGHLRRVDVEGNVGSLINFKVWDDTRRRDPDARFEPRIWDLSRFDLFWLRTGTLSFGNSHLGFCDLEVTSLPESNASIRLEIQPSRRRDQYKKEISKYVNELLKPHIILADFVETEIQTAIGSITEAIKTDFDRFVIGDNVEVRIKIGRKRPNEDKFFKQLEKDELIGVVPQLRRMIKAYCTMTPDHDELYWFRNEEEGAFIPALRTLIALEPSSQDMLRLYFKRCDAEHELGSERVFETLLKSSGWENAEIIRTGICFTIMKFIGGYSNWDYYLVDGGLVAASSEIMSTDTLENVIADEIAEHAKWRRLPADRLQQLQKAMADRVN